MTFSSSSGPRKLKDATPVTQDYLKAIWSATEWGGAAATVSSLADRFGSTRPTVTANLARMVTLGLLIHERYGRIMLTPAGTRLAITMVRRHRLLETYLVDHLAYDLVQVHTEAESLEHAVSDLFIGRIDELLGRPTVDPHGDPIPDRDGGVHYPAAAAELCRAAAGPYRVERVSDADEPQLLELTEVGIAPGALLEVDGDPGDGVRTVRLDGRQHMLDTTAQYAVIVCPR